MDTDLIDELEDLQRRDVATRARLLEQGRLYGFYDEAMQRVHVENAHALDRIVVAHGWPGISMVGLSGCRAAAWQLAQHAICTPGLQRRFLRALEDAVQAGEAPAGQVAFLTDRIRFNEGRPQVYGTVLDWDESGVLGCRVEDPARVDERRASVGLPPFSQALREHRREVEAEGGRSPENFESYREEAARWAQRVGWH